MRDESAFDTVNVEIRANKTHTHIFDRVEDYWKLLRTLPQHSYYDAIGDRLSATHSTLDIALIAPPGASERRRDFGVHGGWCWEDGRSLRLFLAEQRVPHFPGEVQIDMDRCSYIDLAGCPMALSLGKNANPASYFAMVGGFLDSYTSLVAMVNAPTADGLGELLDSLGTMSVVRRPASERVHP